MEVAQFYFYVNRTLMRFNISLEEKKGGKYLLVIKTKESEEIKIEFNIQ